MRVHGCIDGHLLEAGRQLAGHAAGEFSGQFGVSLGVGGKGGVPLRFGFGANGFGVPGGIDLVRNFKGLRDDALYK